MVTTVEYTVAATRQKTGCCQEVQWLHQAIHKGCYQGVQWLLPGSAVHGYYQVYISYCQELQWLLPGSKMVATREYRGC